MATNRCNDALDGAYNFRDLGGLPTGDGRAIRLGRLFRSDSLHCLSEAGVAKLLNEYGVRYLVDLRDAEEVISEGRGLLGVQQLCYVNVPQPQMHNPSGGPDEVLVSQYIDRLDTSEELVDALDMVRSVKRGPTVIHCAAGKDRTGLIVALVLLLVGVPEDEIVKDYMRTGDNMDRIVERFRGSERYREKMATLPAALYMCHEHVIRGFMDVLNSRYGGAREWAASKGLDGVGDELTAALVC